MVRVTTSFEAFFPPSFEFSAINIYTSIPFSLFTTCGDALMSAQRYLCVGVNRTCVLTLTP